MSNRPERLPLRERIEQVGQPYVDEPIYNDVKARATAVEVAAAFGRRMAPLVRVLTGHEHVRLRWMTGDGKGGLKPKFRRDQ
ncbi:MAG TPA: hypothetical protein VF151_10905 [Gemmatimonadales bacterium]